MLEIITGLTIGFLSGNLKRSLGKNKIDGTILLKLILKKRGVIVWTDSN
jgi:hypothetical protein